MATVSTSLNKFANSKVELRCERTRRQSWPSLQFPVLLSYWGWWQVCLGVCFIPVTVCDCHTEIKDYFTWLDNDVIVEKVDIDQNSRSQTAMESIWSVSKLPTESVGSRELVANCSHRRRRRDATWHCRQLRCVGVLGFREKNWTVEANGMFVRRCWFSCVSFGCLLWRNNDTAARRIVIVTLRNIAKESDVKPTGSYVTIQLFKHP